MTYIIKQYKDLLKTSEVTATIAVPQDDFTKYFAQALKHFGKAVKVSGFRPGKVPKDVIIKNVGKAAILEEAANMAIKDTYPKVLNEKKLLIIDAPVINLSELKEGEGIEYTLTAPVPPSFKLPDYKKIAKKHFGTVASIPVTDKEVADAMLDLRRRRKQIELIQKKVAPEKAMAEAQEVKEADLPELDAEFLETLGGFKSLEEFTVALRENLQKDKDAKELNKRRSEFVKTVVSKTDIALPTVLLSHELDRLQAQFEGDLQRVGSNLNAYLKSINKTSEAFLDELKPQAQEQAKLQLILNKIAEEESLTPEQKTVDAETKLLMEHHKDVNKDNARAYITMQMRNQMVFNFLESQK